MIAPGDPDLRLRPAGPVDEAFMRDLFAATRADLFGRTGLDEAMRDRLLVQQYRLQAEGHRRQYPGAEAYVIARRDLPIGRLVLDRQAANWHIVDIAVLPCCRGEGIGATVMAGIEAAARMQAVGALTLTVLAANLGGRRFYQRQGFIEVGRVAGGAYLNVIKALER